MVGLDFRQLARNGFLACALLVCSVALAAQSASGNIIIRLPAAGIIQGQRFDFYLQIDERSSEQALVFMPNLGSGIRVLAGPDIFRSADIASAADRGDLPSPSPGKDYLFVHYVLQAGEAGYQPMPSISVRVGSKVFTSAATLLPVSLASKPGWVPPRLEWSMPASAVYEGQAVLIRLNLRYLDTLVLPQNLESPPVQGGLIEEVKEPGPIEKETISGHDFHILPVAAFMLTPSSSGILRLPAAHLTLDGIPVASLPSEIRVSSLPKDLGNSGAVGNFTISGFIEPEEIGVDEQFTVSIVVQGSGNLHFLQVPKPDFSSLVVLENEDTTDAKPGSNGYEGKRTLKFRLVSSSPGMKSFVIPAFRFLDQSGAVQELPSQTLQARIVTKSQKSEQDQTSGRIALMPADQVIKLAPIFHEGPFFWVFTFMGLLLVAVGNISRVWRKRRPSGVFTGTVLALALVIVAVSIVTGSFGTQMPPEDQGRVQDMEKSWNQGKYDAALELGKELLSRYPGQADLLYNMAELAHASGKPALGLYYLTEAERLAPWRQDIRTRCESLERAAGLDRQLKIVVYPSSFVLALVGVLSFFMAGLVMCLFPARHRGMFYTLGFLLTLSAVGGISLYAMESVQAHAPRAVITETGGALRKIPDLQATEWLSLPSGTSLIRAGKAGDFVLVETAFGIQGWIKKDRIYSGPLGKSLD